MGEDPEFNKWAAQRRAAQGWGEWASAQARRLSMAGSGAWMDPLVAEYFGLDPRHPLPQWGTEPASGQRPPAEGPGEHVGRLGKAYYAAGMGLSLTQPFWQQDIRTARSTDDQAQRKAEEEQEKWEQFRKEQREPFLKEWRQRNRQQAHSPAPEKAPLSPGQDSDDPGPAGITYEQFLKAENPAETVPANQPQAGQRLPQTWDTQLANRLLGPEPSSGSWGLPGTTAAPRSEHASKNPLESLTIDDIKNMDWATFKSTFPSTEIDNPRVEWTRKKDATTGRTIRKGPVRHEVFFIYPEITISRLANGNDLDNISTFPPTDKWAPPTDEWTKTRDDLIKASILEDGELLDFAKQFLLNIKKALDLGGPVSNIYGYFPAHRVIDAQDVNPQASPNVITDIDGKYIGSVVITPGKRASAYPSTFDNFYPLIDMDNNEELGSFARELGHPSSVAHDADTATTAYGSAAVIQIPPNEILVGVTEGRAYVIIPPVMQVHEIVHGIDDSGGTTENEKSARKISYKYTPHEGPNKGKEITIESTVDFDEHRTLGNPQVWPVYAKKYGVATPQELFQVKFVTPLEALKKELTETIEIASKNMASAPDKWEKAILAKKKEGLERSLENVEYNLGNLDAAEKAFLTKEWNVVGQLLGDEKANRIVYQRADTDKTARSSFVQVKDKKVAEVLFEYPREISQEIVSKIQADRKYAFPKGKERLQRQDANAAESVLTVESVSVLCHRVTRSVNSFCSLVFDITGRGHRADGSGRSGDPAVERPRTEQRQLSSDVEQSKNGADVRNKAGQDLGGRQAGASRAAGLETKYGYINLAVGAGELASSNASYRDWFMFGTSMIPLYGGGKTLAQGIKEKDPALITAGAADILLDVGSFAGASVLSLALSLAVATYEYSKRMNLAADWINKALVKYGEKMNAAYEKEYADIVTRLYGATSEEIAEQRRLIDSQYRSIVQQKLGNFYKDVQPGSSPEEISLRLRTGLDESGKPRDWERTLSQSSGKIAQAFKKLLIDLEELRQVVDSHMRLWDPDVKHNRDKSMRAQEFMDWKRSFELYRFIEPVFEKIEDDAAKNVTPEVKGRVDSPHGSPFGQNAMRYKLRGLASPHPLVAHLPGIWDTWKSVTGSLVKKLPLLTPDSAAKTMGATHRNHLESGKDKKISLHGRGQFTHRVAFRKLFSGGWMITSSRKDRFEGEIIATVVPTENLEYEVRMHPDAPSEIRFIAVSYEPQTSTSQGARWESGRINKRGDSIKIPGFRNARIQIW
ncbi:hypothetical protein [Streptomyces sp. YIM 121038]|uniref:hypothetical protein n=1 Tax=Streptomyces sp. YIM 121038 TaxID=2136401 RepID=UPI0011108673|nr:hypothetical protein [Streptomyces sp. YIM 121038]